MEAINETRMKRWILLTCCLAFLAPMGCAAERLVYSVSQGGFLQSKTEVFSISFQGGQPVRIFSDASTPLLLTQPGVSTLIGNHMFTPGLERPVHSNVRATGIFDLSMDGTGRYRKVLDLPAGERVDWLTVAGDGTKLAYLSQSANALTLFIHDVRTGSLVRKLEMAKIAGECPVRHVVWLADNKTLIFTLEEGVDGFMEDADYKRIGLWQMQDDGTALTHLPDSFGVVQEPGYRYFRNRPPVMLGVMNGQYLLEVPLQKTSLTPPYNSFLALADPHSAKSVKIVLPPFLSEFAISLNGRYVASIQQAPSKYVGNQHIVPPAHLLIGPLSGGDPKDVLTMETGPERGVSLTVNGWMSD